MDGCDVYWDVVFCGRGVIFEKSGWGEEDRFVHWLWGCVGVCWGL